MSMDAINNVMLDKTKYEVSAGANDSGKKVTNVDVGGKSAAVVLCEQLGVTPEEYCTIASNPEFQALKTLEEQIAYVNQWRQEIAAKSETASALTGETPAAEETAKELISEQIQSSNAADAAEESDENSEIQEAANRFSKKEFDKLDLKSKFQSCMAEAARNKYLYGGENISSEDSWDNLSEEERNKLVSDYSTEFMKKNGKYKELFSEKDEEELKFHLNSMMNEIQASNYKQMSLEKFNQMSDMQQLSAIYENIEEQVSEHQFRTNDFSEDNLGLSKSDAAFYKRNKEMSRAISLYIEKQTGEETHLCPDQAYKYLEDNKNKINMLEVHVGYLESKENLTEEEKERLNNLKTFMASNLYKVVERNFKCKDPEALFKNSAIEEDISKSKYGEAFNESEGGHKLAVAVKYLRDTAENDADYHAKMETYLKDAIDRGDINQVMGLSAVVERDEGLQAYLAKSESWQSVLAVGLNIDSMSAENTGTYAQTVENLDNKELSVALGVHIRKTEKLSDDQRIEIAKVKSESEEVQMANIDMQVGAKTAEAQIEIGKNIHENSYENVRVEAVKRTGELLKEAQLPTLDQAMADGNEAVIEMASNTVSDLHKDNQTEGLKMVKTSASKVSDEFAKEVEINLADQVAKCHKDNQLEMHKEIMSSKYSEVQEHAASNIKDYHASIQSEAVDVVYESGNSKAIQAVVENINKMAVPDVQKTEIVKFACEIVSNNITAESQIQETLGSGTLTARELSKLSPSQRREYFVNMFNNAPENKKLELLMKFAELAGLAHKRTIYTLIARSPMLQGVVAQGMGKTMIDAGLPVDAVNKIIQVMKRSTNHKVQAQLSELKLDSNFSQYFDKDDVAEAKNKKNSSVPDAMKSTYAANVNRAKAAELRDKDSTMYLNA